MDGNVLNNQCIFQSFFDKFVGEHQWMSSPGYIVRRWLDIINKTATSLINILINNSRIIFIKPNTRIKPHAAFELHQTLHHSENLKTHVSQPFHFSRIFTEIKFPVFKPFVLSDFHCLEACES